MLFLEVDYEQQSSYSLTLEAKDGGNRSTHVVILVEIVDVNDNTPVFNSLEYKRTIREGGTEFQPKFFVQVRKYTIYFSDSIKLLNDLNVFPR